jgi:hypothetical protein
MATVTTLPSLRLSLIDLRDQGSIAIVDLSSYGVLPITADISLQITPPGWPTLNVPFNPGVVNVYKCGDLGITCPIVDCCPLPDGIYNVVYTVRYIPVGSASSAQQTTTINQTFIKVDQLDCRFSNLFLKVDLECDCTSDDQKKYKQQLREVDLLKNGAVAAANDCDELLAYKLYAQADRYIDRIYAQFCSQCSPIPSCDKCN